MRERRDSDIKYELNRGKYTYIALIGEALLNIIGKYLPKHEPEITYNDLWDKKYNNVKDVAETVKEHEQPQSKTKDAKQSASDNEGDDEYGYYLDDTDVDDSYAPESVDFSDEDDNDFFKRLYDKYGIEKNFLGNRDNNNVSKLIWFLTGNKCLPTKDADDNILSGKARRQICNELFSRDNQEIQQLFRRLFTALIGVDGVRQRSIENLIEKPLSKASDYYVKMSQIDPEKKDMSKDQKKSAGFLNDHELSRKNQRNNVYSFTDYEREDSSYDGTKHRTSEYMAAIKVFDYISAYDKDFMEELFDDTDEREKIVAELWSQGYTIDDTVKRTDLTKRQVERRRNNIKYRMLRWLYESKRMNDFNAFYEQCSKKYKNFENNYNKFVENIQLK